MSERRIRLMCAWPLCCLILFLVHLDMRFGGKSNFWRREPVTTMRQYHPVRIVVDWIDPQRHDLSLSDPFEVRLPSDPRVFDDPVPTASPHSVTGPGQGEPDGTTAGIVE